MPRRLSVKPFTLNNMYAIVEINGQQFKVEEGKKLFVNHIKDAEEGKTVEFDKVLLLDNDGTVTVGAPAINGAKVVAEVLNPLVKGDKIIVFKMKRRKDYRKKNGQLNRLYVMGCLSQRYKDEGSNLYVVMDGVYSQDGDRGLVREYLEISQKHGALLVVDDAHGIGVLGENGAGLLEELNLLGKVPLVTGTLSKAFGSIGGYVSGRKELIDYIRYYAGSCCFSVSLPPPCLAAALKSLELIQKATSERKELLAKAQYAREKLQEAGFSTTDSTTPIVGILTPSYDEAILWAERLLQHDVPIGYPAVSKRCPRLRLALSNLHSYRDIDFLISKLLTVTKKDYKYMPRKRRSSAEIAHLIDKATENIVREKGFGGLSIQEVCDQAEIEPALFYRRYPEGFAFYVEKFIRDHDFWLSHYEEFPVEKLNRSPENLTQILLYLWKQIAEDGLLSSLLRLELQDSPLDAAVEIAKVREIQTEDLVDFFTQASESPNTLKIQLAILTAGIQYLALHKNISTFCGIDFTSIPEQEIEIALMQILKPIMGLK